MWSLATFIGKYDVEKKIEPKEIPSCLIPHLLVVFTRQIEILVTALGKPIHSVVHVPEKGIEKL